MKKITEQSIRAFLNTEKFNSTNTQTNCTLNTSELLLHGSVIAKRDRTGIYISNAGYTTNTTKERLNVLLGSLELPRIEQKNFQWYWNNKPFPDNEFIKIK